MSARGKEINAVLASITRWERQTTRNGTQRNQGFEGPETWREERHTDLDIF